MEAGAGSAPLAALAFVSILFEPSSPATLVLQAVKEKRAKASSSKANAPSLK
jgi:hypothetical protein